MTNLMAKVNAMVKKADPKNAEYILEDHRFISDVETMIRFEKKGDQNMVDFMMEQLEEKARAFDGQYLTPGNAKVGEGATMQMYSDAHAGTIIKVTKTTVTVQRDTAKRDPNWKPEIIPGGFAGHCVNQNEQTYSYEKNENGEIVTFKWSKKYGQFRNGKQHLTLTKGRHEFYDYNF